ncbi:hypothetical protein [Delftia acidovorans]|uniref:hypothetical protein n=1 Tax=Delftia acidovorans TaxID=80866 RepID=UPI000F826530|nr:hypothetical protein [Delftia acidovorans]
MKKEHPHAQVLRWIADGETVQFLWARSDDSIWHELKKNATGSSVAISLLDGDGEYQFRIKPKTIRIGDREIEAPVMSGPGYFITEAGFELQFFADSRDTAGYADVQKRGHVFASIEAARAAQEAITALLTREPS